METGICIIGAGPAGLMAAIHAAQAGASTVVVESGAKAGRKLLLTGGGRCNLTHVGRPEEIERAFGKAGRFLRHSLHALCPDDVLEFFRVRGLAGKIEPDGCVFPAGDKAAEVLSILIQQAVTLGVRFLFGLPVVSLEAVDGGFVILMKNQRIPAKRVIIATGGASWPQTGSTGDGYRFAAQLGHTVIPPKPALVPLVTRETWVQELAGVSLSGVRIWAIKDKRRLAVEGNMLFTQKGIGGPAVLDLSRLLVDDLSDKGQIDIKIDVAAGLDEPGFDRLLQERIQASPKKTVPNVLSEFMPRQLALLMCRLAQCDDDLPAGQLKAQVRKCFVSLIKGLPLCITGTEPIAKATVTRGGVSTQEIDPRTMASKIRPGLFFAGEVINVDGPCGGYNLQACWSTGALAGRCAACSLSGDNPLA